MASIETKITGIQKLSKTKYRIHTKDGTVKTFKNFRNLIGSNVIIDYELNKRAEAILTNIIKVYY
tara:strand:- start:247 stop:441 length:195 start_codon:yes stop_codon:yes gene_type:complete